MSSKRGIFRSGEERNQNIREREKRRENRGERYNRGGWKGIEIENKEGMSDLRKEKGEVYRRTENREGVVLRTEGHGYNRRENKGRKEKKK